MSLRASARSIRRRRSRRGDAVVAGHDHHHLLRQTRARTGGDAGDLRCEPLQTPQAAGRLGQLVLTQPRLKLGSPIEGSDLRNDFLQLRLGVWQMKTPCGSRTDEGACSPARALSLEGRWLETEAGIRTRGRTVALTVAAQRRLHTGLSLFLRREYAVVNVRPDKPSDATILLQCRLHSAWIGCRASFRRRSTMS